MKRLTYLEENNGVWEQLVVDIPEEDYESTRTMLINRGRNKLDTGFDPDTGEEIEVLPVDVERELTDAEKLNSVVDFMSGIAEELNN